MGIDASSADRPGLLDVGGAFRNAQLCQARAMSQWFSPWMHLRACGQRCAGDQHHAEFASCHQMVLPAGAALWRRFVVNQKRWIGRACAPLHARFVSKTDVNFHVPGSFDHLVCGREQPIRVVEAKCLGGREIEHEIEIGRLGATSRA